MTSHCPLFHTHIEITRNTNIATYIMSVSGAASREAPCFKCEDPPQKKPKTETAPKEPMAPSEEAAATAKAKGQPKKPAKAKAQPKKPAKAKAQPKKQPKEHKESEQEHDQPEESGDAKPILKRPAGR